MIEQQDLQQFLKINTWVFDLDDTLYPRDSGLWAQIDKRISAYVKKQLLVDDAEIIRLRKYYRQTYGGALKGMLVEHHIDADDYLADVHNIDYSALKPNPQLAKDISKLPGKKFIFTNGDAAHAMRVLNKIGLNNCFDGIFDVTYTDFVPKPYQQAYDSFIKHFALEPQTTAMFEDNLANLEMCKKLGMTTIFVGDKPQTLIPSYVDIAVNGINDFVHKLAESLHG